MAIGKPLWNYCRRIISPLTTRSYSSIFAASIYRLRGGRMSSASPRQPPSAFRRKQSSGNAGPGLNTSAVKPSSLFASLSSPATVSLPARGSPIPWPASTPPQTSFQKQENGSRGRKNSVPTFPLLFRRYPHNANSKCSGPITNTPSRFEAGSKIFWLANVRACEQKDGAPLDL